MSPYTSFYFSVVLKVVGFLAAPEAACQNEACAVEPFLSVKTVILIQLSFFLQTLR